MKRTIPALVLSLLLCDAALTADAPMPDCAAMESAHRSLTYGCFTVRRELAVTINDRPHLRETALVHNAGGVLTVEIIEKEILKKGLQLDSDEGDMAISVPFVCSQFSELGNGQFELASADEPERVILGYDATESALLPLRWIFETVERFLFKKYRIHAEAVYTEMRFLPCATGPARLR